MARSRKPSAPRATTSACACWSAGRQAIVSTNDISKDEIAALPERAVAMARVLTHCNTGPLACGQYGTALGVVQAAHHAGRTVHVWVDETRPYLQGARLTTWELAQAGVAPHAAPRRGRRAPDGPRRGGRRARRRRPGGRQRRHRQQGRHLPAGRPGGAPRHPVLRLRADELGRPRDRRRRRHRDRGAQGRGGPRVPRRPHRAAGHGGPQPGLRRHAGRAHHRHRDRGGRHARPVRGRPAERRRARRARRAGAARARRSGRSGRPPWPAD